MNDRDLEAPRRLKVCRRERLSHDDAETDGPNPTAAGAAAELIVPATASHGSSMDGDTGASAMIEKPDQAGSSAASADGGHDRDRTCDPYHVKVVLSR